MNVSEFVVKVANPYFALHDHFSDITEDFLMSSVDFAVRNKVFPLFYEGCLRLGINLPNEANQLMDRYERRRKMQIEEISLLLDISDKFDIELMFFKTFKPFRYFPDDIDVLLRNEIDLQRLIAKLREKGYFVLKIGTPEVVLRKVGKGAYVDLDIHKKLAVGYLDLFRVETLWQKRAYEMFKLDSGHVALKLSNDYEVVREAAYSLLKDFNLSMPGLFFAIYAMMKGNLETVERIAAEGNLLLPLYLYLETAYFLARKLFGFKTNLFSRFNNGIASDLSLRIVRSQLSKKCKVPYPYPIPVIAWAYLSKAWLGISRDRNLKALTQIIKQPSSKGIGIFLHHLERPIP